MSLLTRAVQAVLKEINTPETFRKGEEFEAYVRHYLFPKEKYTLLQKTHDYAENKDDFVDSTKEPDYKFNTSSGKTFFLEVKYRANYFKGAIEWCKYYQLKRYQKIDQNTPVYVVIGTGSQPDNPSQLFLIPLKEIKYVKLFKSFLRSYEVPTNRCISESQLV